jgi:predicted 2-oxoglutarate/Fe(II)-dependent dioxygenase YbiX
MQYVPITDKIFTIENFLTPEECGHYIDLSEKINYEMAKVDADRGQRVLTEIRNNSRAFYESPELARAFWERLQPFVPAVLGNSIAVGLNERFRFYKYEPGQRFKGHIDGSFIRNAQEASYFTFMIYLNDDYEGGETKFLEHKISPRKGMALLFLHNLYHEGSEVMSGVKYVLRTDVMYHLKD